MGPSREALPWAYCVGLLDINHMVVVKRSDASIIYLLPFLLPKGISERDEVEHMIQFSLYILCYIMALPKSWRENVQDVESSPDV